MALQLIMRRAIFLRGLFSKNNFCSDIYISTIYISTKILLMRDIALTSTYYDVILNTSQINIVAILNPRNIYEE